MKQKGDPGFSWTLLFAVTSGSFFIFSLLTKLLEGSPDHSSLFFKIGLAALGIAAISGISDLVTKTASDE